MTGEFRKTFDRLWNTGNTTLTDSEMRHFQAGLIGWLEMKYPFQEYDVIHIQQLLEKEIREHDRDAKKEAD